MYKTKDIIWIVCVYISTLIATLVVALFLIDRKSTSSHETAVIQDKVKDSKPLEVENYSKHSLESYPQEVDDFLIERTIGGPINLTDEDIVEFQRIVRESQLRLLEIEFKNIKISSPSENKYIISISSIPVEERDVLLENLKAEFSLLESVQKGDADIERLMFAAEKHFRNDLASKNFGELDREIELTINPQETVGRDPSFDYAVSYDGVVRRGNYLVPDTNIPLFLAPYVQAILNQDNA